MTQTGFIASSMIALVLLNTNSSFALLRAGASSRIITPQSPAYLAGLRNNRLSQGVHDDLFAVLYAQNFCAGDENPHVHAGQRDPGVLRHWCVCNSQR